MDYSLDKPHFEQMTDNDIDADIYYKTLCSSGLSFVNKQHSQIEQKRINLIENKQKLVYSNYDSIIKFSNFSKELINDFQDIENNLSNLKKTIPQFKEKCEIFSNNAQKISSRWKNVSLMLAKYPQLIEFLEIPQLLNNCIRTYYYEDALQICNHISRFCGKHSHVAPIFKNLLVEIDKSKDVMIAQIMKEMNNNLQLPDCIKLVGYLRRTNRFTETELRINFLMARDVWFQTSLKKNAPNVYSLNYISSVTEVFRINIFDIVTQYRAIFPKIEMDSLSVNDNLSKADLIDVESKIINSWMMVKINQYINILQECLNSSLNYNGQLSFDTVIDHCFYFGLSMSKIGADIRPKLTLVFNQFIQKRFEIQINNATKRFENSMDDIFKLFKSNEKSQNSYNDFETNIEEFPVIVNYLRDLFEVFNEVRCNTPLSMFSFFAKALNRSFESICEKLKSYLKIHEYSLNSDELKLYIRFCNTLSSQGLPLINAKFQKLCPLSTISQKFGITLLDLGKIQSFRQLELNIQNTIANVNQIVSEISTKL